MADRVNSTAGFVQLVGEPQVRKVPVRNLFSLQKLKALASLDPFSHDSSAV